MKKKTFAIAIDGPVGSGKGTLALALAKRLDALYIYTGGMYRELTLTCLKEGVDLHDEEAVMAVLNKALNKDASGEIYSPEVSRLTPIVAAFPRVREEMVRRQKALAQKAIENGKSVVMEGRDITTEVLPQADLKIYLTASIEKRAERRNAQFEKRGIKREIPEIISEIKERDRQDSERSISPLTIAKDAFVIDTTNDTVVQTVEKVMEKVKEMGLA